MAAPVKATPFLALRVVVVHAQLLSLRTARSGAQCRGRAATPAAGPSSRGGSAARVRHGEADGQFHTMESREEDELLRGPLVGRSMGRRSRPEPASNGGGGRKGGGLVRGGERTTRWCGCGSGSDLVFAADRGKNGEWGTAQGDGGGVMWLRQRGDRGGVRWESPRMINCVS
jgi:hypothetical protein